MKIIAITKDNCPKCEWAKKKLEAFKITWFNYDTDEEAKELARKHRINDVPAFIIDIGPDGPIVTNSVYTVSHFFLDRE